MEQDKQRIDSLVKEYSDYLYQYARLHVSQDEIAEDLVQETFISAFRALSGFRGESSIKTWLTSILRRKIIDYYRKRAKSSTEISYSVDPFLRSGPREGHWNPAMAPGSWKENPSELLRQKEFLEILDRCLSQLPETARAVFVMKEVDGEDSDFICKELGISSSNLWVLMHRARLALRACLEKNWMRQK